MKTLVIRSGEKVTIRAVAFSTEQPNWDKCETLAFLQKHRLGWPKELEKLAAALKEMCDSGPPLEETRFKKLKGTDGLCEFKSPQGLRLICFWDDGGLIICTHGYVKGSQKMPQNEIKRGQKIMRDYFEVKRNGALIHVEQKRKTN